MKSKLSSLDWSLASEKICELLIQEFSEYKGTIAGYWPIDYEFDIRPFMEWYYAQSGQVCLPVVENKTQPLVFYPWQPGDVLECGIYNTSVPVNRKHPIVPEVVLTPLVAYDHQNYRLGRGGGLYDRTINQYHRYQYKTVFIGLATMEHCVNNIPRDANDEKLDKVLVV